MPLFEATSLPSTPFNNLQRPVAATCCACSVSVLARCIIGNTYGAESSRAGAIALATSASVLFLGIWILGGSTRCSERSLGRTGRNDSPLRRQYVFARYALGEYAGLHCGVELLDLDVWFAAAVHFHWRVRWALFFLRAWSSSSYCRCSGCWVAILQCAELFGAAPRKTLPAC